MNLPTLTRYPVKGIVTLCGSHRFKDTFERVAQELGMKYWIVLRPAFYVDAHTYIDNSPKTALDIVHLAKINLSEAIIVINNDYPPIHNPSYIGQSTKREIEYARNNYKRVFWLVPSKEWLPNEKTFADFNQMYNK